MLAPWKKSYDKPRHYIKKQRHYFTDTGPTNQSSVFSGSYVWMWVLDHKESWVLEELMLLVLEKTLETNRMARRLSQSILKETVLNIHWRDWCWNSNTLATWCKELTHWKRPWWWERLKAGGEADIRGWDGSMKSLTQWTWVWASSGSWWWTGKPGVLQSMGSQTVGYDWVTELTD